MAASRSSCGVTSLLEDNGAITFFAAVAYSVAVSVGIFVFWSYMLRLLPSMRSAAGFIGLTIWAVQMIWIPFLAAGVITAVSYALVFVEDGAPFILAWSTIPVAIGFAVFRYRLYDIDRIISRTLAYAIVIGVLAAIYVGLVTAIGSQFESSLSVATSTLAVAALFNPLRRRVQDWVDRHFNRSAYDTGQVMDDFAESLRDEVDAGSVVEGWVEVVEETMQPEVVSLWVRPAAAISNVRETA